MRHAPTLISVLIAALLVGGAAFYVNQKGEQERNVQETKSTSISPMVPVQPRTKNIDAKYQFSIAVGEPGSEHSHMRLAFFIDDQVVDFAKEKYMLQDRRAHFEDDEGSIIHKHAVGVNLPFFFSTLGIRINQDCFSFDGITEYCANDSKKLNFIINGEKMNDIFSYELQDGDIVLISYSEDAPAELISKFNIIPEVPVGL